MKMLLIIEKKDVDKYEYLFLHAMRKHVPEIVRHRLPASQIMIVSVESIAMQFSIRQSTSRKATISWPTQKDASINFRHTLDSNMLD
ncbi:hypothetical protein CJU94_01630 [Paraburkholderia aromaticivorans]|uniref:Uncharacterized protein n=1 Tax=Paraburkholderia aromaticivorans TaxID=2026199 RepID=A0A248VEZ2_9BURK|nr:hypothetical protein CJU94_01630 [Paraburkholderia aromaticivorans]